MKRDFDEAVSEVRAAFDAVREGRAADDFLSGFSVGIERAAAFCDVMAVQSKLADGERYILLRAAELIRALK